MIKLFATDLDGTLLNKDHVLDDYLISGIKKLLDAGYIFCPSTGRNPTSPILPGLDEFCPHVYFNGALVKDVEGRVVYESLLRKDLITDLVETFPHIYFEFCAEDKIYCPKKGDGYVEQIESFFSSDRMPGMEWRRAFVKKRFDDISFGVPVSEICELKIYKCNVLTDPVDSEIEYIKGLYDFVDKNRDRVINTPFMKNAIEFTDPKGNKGEGVMQLCRYLGIGEDEVCVYGDGENDLAMLEYFPNSYAPSDAMPKAKEAAKHIIGPYDEYSVINHMLEVAGV